jgi:hypothetical protein
MLLTHFRRWIVTVVGTFAAFAAPAPALAESLVSPIPIVIPSNVSDSVGSASSLSTSYFSFTAVAGQSYLIAPERINPVTGEIFGPASFQVSIVTNDASRTVVAFGQASNTIGFVTPPLQNGGYLIYIDDGLVGYTFAQNYWLRTAVAGVGGVPFGPVPGQAAVTPASLTPSSSRVRGGTSVTFTVTLSTPAPSGGTVVSLSSSSSLASVPASVTVAGGARTVTFTASTQTVNRNSDVTVSARAGGTTRSSTITLTR